MVMVVVIVIVMVVRHAGVGLFFLFCRLIQSCVSLKCMILLSSRSVIYIQILLKN